MKVTEENLIDRWVMDGKEYSFHCDNPENPDSEEILLIKYI